MERPEEIDDFERFDTESLKPITENYNPPDKYKDVVFTSDQEVAIEGILDFISDDYNKDKACVGLIGAGGVGKTFVTNYIIDKCQYSSSLIKCASPTHKACRVFSSAINGKKVETIQSVFGLRLDMNIEDFDPNNPRFSPKSSPKLDNIRLLIVDEASMLPIKLVNFVVKTCKELNIKIIFIGDNSQLAPVKEKSSVAFTQCFKIFSLNQVVRQSIDNPLTELLKLLRYDISNKTNKFLEFIFRNTGANKFNDLNEGYTICNSSDFQKTLLECFSDKDFEKNIDLYKIVCYTNPRVAFWNKFIRTNIIKDSQKDIITKHDLLMSYKTTVNDFNEIVINNSEEYIIHDIVNYVDPTYDLKGFLVRLQLVQGGSITPPLFIIDHRDKFTINNYVRISNALESDGKNSNAGNRASNWKKYYAFKNKYLLAANVISANGRLMMARDLDYGFSITSHKSQGSTYTTVFVDLKDMLYDKNGNLYSDRNDVLRRIYVACSRAKKQLIIHI